MMKILLLTTVIFGVCMALLAVGLIVGRTCLRGSCHHAAKPVMTPNGESLVCPRCEKEIEKRSTKT